MSIIQNIRDKYARIAVVAIALALLGFILMDAFAGRTGLFGDNGPGNNIGKVNGTAIDRVEFANLVSDREAQYEEQFRQQQRQLTNEDRFQIMNEVWEQEVVQTILKSEYEKLGLTVTERELRDVLYNSIAQSFTDPKTGQVNSIVANQRISEALKSNDPRTRSEIENAKKQRLATKYMALFSNTNHFPNWFLEKRNIDNSLQANASFVSLPYSSVPDSTVKVSDDEIKAYVKDNKERFEQKEESRSISYVLFSASPTAADSAAVRTQVESFKNELAAATDVRSLITRESSIQFFDAYVGKTAMQVPAKDTLVQLSAGSVYGPYQDGNSYVIAKMIESRMLPDSVKCRHILLRTTDDQGQPLNDSVVKQRIDSISTAIRNGANFDSLETKYTMDQGAHQQKGVMTFSSTDIQSDNFAKEFAQFILFDGKPGDKKNIKTQFGWHYIEIMEHKNVEPHYKIAYLAKPIVASDETNNEAVNKATQFAGDSRDLESFNQNADKLKTEGINKFPAVDLSPLTFSIPGLGSARSFVKAVFDADKGDIIGPERIGANYVVAVVTEVNEPGLKTATAARPVVEPILKRKKQAEQIIKNIGQVTTLEQVSQKFGQPISPMDSVSFGGSSFGFEPRLLGAVFNPANKGKVVTEPVVGNQGVYVLRVNNQYTVPVPTANFAQQRTELEQEMQQRGMNALVEALKKSSKIKDNRAEFY